jgi:hypothetical protein
MSATTEPGELKESRPKVDSVIPVGRAAELKELLKKKKQAEAAVEIKQEKVDYPMVAQFPTMHVELATPVKKKTIIDPAKTADNDKRARPRSRSPEKTERASKVLRRDDSRDRDRQSSPLPSRRGRDSSSGTSNQRDSEGDYRMEYRSTYRRRSPSPIRRSTMGSVGYDGRTIRDTSTEFVDARRSTLSLIE